ncbi:MAG: LLM class flavin-dependent oxidoreductase [Flaviflexus sp.]|nr:LLM class flavin-dependent oxidoreductase [Flaviflexus sp.]
MAVPLSVLDLAPVSTGSTRAAALNNSLKLAIAAEQAGYFRYWMAEHHGSPTFMSSATSLLLGRAAEHTSTIRLGSGGVMLPNHAPLMVAEYYGTLATIYGDRIDLGLGRAPGTDPVTAAELKRGDADLRDFTQDVTKLQRYLAPAEPGGFKGVSGAEAGVLGISVKPYQLRRNIRAIPGEGTQVPLWVLGSSTGGASVAAELGLPFSFASHFAPGHMSAALATYRENFNAMAETAEIPGPRVMAGINVMVCEDTHEAHFQFTTNTKLRSDLFFGQSRPLAAPRADRVDRTKAEGINPTAFVGNPAEVAEKIDTFVTEHAIDELIITCYAFDPEIRLASYELLAKEYLG